MCRKYVGITIGPILDTIVDASSPAAMWFSSFLFSDITRRICDRLTAEEAFPNLEIYSPYYSSEIDIFQDGIGKYHDRILFAMEPKTEDYEVVLKNLITNVKKETASYFAELDSYDKEKTEQFLDQYFQIYYVIRDIIDKNIILDMSDQLSALELMKTFPGNNSENPISRLMVGYEAGKNQLIKESRLYRNIKNRETLEENGRIRSLEMIAASKMTSGLKVGSYFAVVNADGDRMGVTLAALKNDQLNHFSRKLFVHASNAAAAIKEYGGMTIYAGGDDLLFLAPVIGNDGATIFDLCDVIRKEFEEQWKEEKAASPTLSFGISIQYYKAPLYEALEKSRNMLADSKMKNGKNRTTVHVQKHSGQSLYLSIANGKLSDIDHFLKAKEKENYTEESNILHSQIYTLEEYRPVFVELVQRAVAEHMESDKFVRIWLHMFDNESQSSFKNEITQNAVFFYDKLVTQQEGKTVETIRDGVTDEANHLIRVFSTLLRLKKFTEEGGNEE